MRIIVGFCAHCGYVCDIFLFSQCGKSRVSPTYSWKMVMRSSAAWKSLSWWWPTITQKSFFFFLSIGSYTGTLVRRKGKKEERSLSPLQRGK